MQRITVEQAAYMAGVAKQTMRAMIQHNIVDGAKCYGPKDRKTYYVTDAHIENFMKGGTGK